MPDLSCCYPDWLSGSCYYDCSSLASELCLCSECPWFMEDSPCDCFFLGPGSAGAFRVLRPYARRHTDRLQAFSRRSDLRRTSCPR